MLQVGVLSVVAQQILTLVSARREGRDTFVLEGGKPLTLDPRGFLAVTMNPQYPGRVSLPDNLKVSTDEETDEVIIIKDYCCEWRVSIPSFLCCVGTLLFLCFKECMYFHTFFAHSLFLKEVNLVLSLISIGITFPFTYR